MQSERKQTEIEVYVDSIKNPKKRQYATQVATCLLSNQSYSNVPSFGLSFMARQAVEIELRKMLDNHLHVYRPASIGDSMTDAMSCRICRKLKDGWTPIYKSI